MSMAMATILKRNDDGSSQCKCWNCGREFRAGGKWYWHNHFYCSSGCGEEYVRKHPYLRQQSCECHREEDE